MDNHQTQVMAKLAVLEERIKNISEQIATSNIARNLALEKLERDLTREIDDLRTKYTWLVRLVWLVLIAFASTPFWDLLDLVRVAK